MSNRTLDSVINELFRSTIGFDDLFNVFEGKPLKQPNFPPYNIVKTDTGHVLDVALAGYSNDDIEVTVDDDRLTIKTVDDLETVKDEDDSNNVQYRGISKRKFNLSFTLGRKLEVSSAKLENGLLMVNIDSVNNDNLKKIEIT